MSNWDELSYQEIRDCIRDAEAGRLSPYWQGYARRELASLRRPDGTLPPQAEQLRRKLRCCWTPFPRFRTKRTKRSAGTAGKRGTPPEFSCSGPKDKAGPSRFCEFVPGRSLPAPKRLSGGCPHRWSCRQEDGRPLAVLVGAAAAFAADEKDSARLQHPPLWPAAPRTGPAAFCKKVRRGPACCPDKWLPAHAAGTPVW